MRNIHFMKTSLYFQYGNMSDVCGINSVDLDQEHIGKYLLLAFHLENLSIENFEMWKEIKVVIPVHS